MKILLLTTHLNIGGVSVYTVNLAKHLKKEGIEISVASSGGELENVLFDNNIPHIKIEIKTKFEFSHKVLRSLPVLVKLIKHNDFQVIHAQTRVTQVLASIAANLTHISFMSTCHGFFEHKRLSRKLFPCWGDEVIAISDDVRRHLLEDFKLDPNHVKMIHNGIELEKYLSITNEKDRVLMDKIGMNSDVQIVGAVGRLSSVKGFKYLINAFRDVIRKHPDSHLLIVGEGKEKNALEKQVYDIGISDKVTITANEFPLVKYLAIMDIFCLPSILEGLGLSLMEAMASEKACIASNIGGISDLITDGEDGVLVPPKNSIILAENISRLLEDAELRKTLGVQARKKAGGNFSIIDSTKKTVEVYAEVIEGHGSRGKNDRCANVF